MTRSTHLALAFALAAPAILASAPAAAQMQRTWVADTGNDSADCSQATPCKTFAGAYAKTAIKGEINCLSAGGFGPLLITHSVSILCDGVTGRISSNITNAIAILAGSDDAVLLSGLDITGTGNGENGVRVISGGTVHVRNSVIHNLIGSPVTLDTGENTRLILENLLIESNGTPGALTTGGIALVPNYGGFKTSVTLDHVRVINNVGAGLRIDTVTKPGTNVVVTVTDSEFVGNAVGIQVKTGSSAASIVTVRNSTISGNTVGILTNGIGAAAAVGGSTIFNNGTGLVANQGAEMRSYGDNALIANANDGAFNGTVLVRK